MRPAGSVFTIPDDARPGATEAPEAFATTAMPSLLALQEAGQEAGQQAGVEAARDREARRHGSAMLDALAMLQRSMLGGQDRQGVESLQSLARLVQATPPPSDPALAAVQRALLVRVAVELARQRGAATQSHCAASV
jgi:hypothetical protein